ncbi:24919_t:CDS:2, partial [Gigaspora rosea]
KITSIAYNKAQNKGTLKQYNDLKIRQEICYSHYLDIVEPDRYTKPLVEIKEMNVNDKPVAYCNTQKSPSNNGLVFADQVQILMKVLYQLQQDKPGFIELSPICVQKNRSKTTVVSLCYMMANIQNMFVNSFELEVGLYLSASRILFATIDTLHNLSVM